MNPQQSEIREFKISGGAEVFGKTRGRRQGQGSRKQGKEQQQQQGGQVNVQKQSGGSADAIVGAGVNIVNGRSVMTAGAVPLATRTPVVGYDAPRAGPISGAPVLGAPAMRGGQQQQRQEQQQGGRKVELGKPPAQHRKVLLNPKKYKIAGETHQHPRTKTRKVRKITLGMKTMQKRLTRAKKIHTDVKDIPLVELRKQLIQRKLIRETSKAPESILRQIAADAQIVAGKGL
jgi:hypothetical protein